MIDEFLVADGTNTSLLGGHRRRTRRLMVALAGLLLIGISSACESTPADRSAVIDQVNASRAQAGLPPLRENIALDRKADAWAQHLRNVCSLSHSQLSDGAPSDWMKLGENVGYGGNIAQVHDAYMHSPGHRANILDPSFTSIGAAAVWGDCPDGSHRVFTVQEFMHT
jgi:uncharacterized protein YkwD